MSVGSLGFFQKPGTPVGASRARRRIQISRRLAAIAATVSPLMAWSWRLAKLTAFRMSLPAPPMPLRISK